MAESRQPQSPANEEVIKLFIRTMCVQSVISVDSRIGEVTRRVERNPGCGREFQTYAEDHACRRRPVRGGRAPPRGQSRIILTKKGGGGTQAPGVMCVMYV